MENWIGSAVRQRREELLAQAAHARMLRKLESGRSRSIRGRAAGIAQALSDALAQCARVLREHEA
jgi:hypothetical protein